MFGSFPRYPDATAEELQAMDNVCIICREEMLTGAKRLPCNHIFHTSPDWDPVLILILILIPSQSHPNPELIPILIPVLIPVLIPS
ncbi:hypothetical protein TURU_000510 [Turdus rufiventris]|nr:hypothetical protein TURU_000510 [Turdus rufiventris]